jgi:hypothetical protein
MLIPLVGIGAIAMAVSARARERLGWIVLALAVVAGISTQLAITSGQALQDHVPRSADLRHHVDIAESIRPLILALFLATLLLMLVDRRTRGSWPFTDAQPKAVPVATSVAMGIVAVVFAVGANFRLVQIGDSGAKATWGRVNLNTPEPGFRGRGD